MSTRLGRWCVKTSEVYKHVCQPELKAMQAIYDNGFESMTVHKPYWERTTDEKRNEEESVNPIARLFVSWHG